jgi:hypothetical protein
MTNNSRRNFLLLVLVINIVHFSFGLYYARRVAAAIHPTLTARGEEYLRTYAGWGTDTEMDSAAINRTATSILRRGLPYSRDGTLILRNLAYSYFVAACYAIGGVRLLPVAVAQSILSGLTGAVLAVAAARLFPRRPIAGWIAGGLYLLNARIAMYVVYLSPTILALFFTAVAFWAVTRWTPNSWRVITTCLVLGVYTSPTFFVVALAAAGWLLLQRAPVAGPIVIVAFAALKFVVAWSNVAGVRTEPNRSADRGGTLWFANNPYYERMRPWSLWELRGNNPHSTWTMSENEYRQYEEYHARAGYDDLRAALLWIRENPGHYAQICLARLRTEFGPYTGQMSPRNRLISTFVWSMLFPAGFCGLWLMRRDPAGQFVVFVVLAVFAFATLVVEEGYLRYRMPVDLLLTAFAAGAYAQWLPWQRGQK